VARPFSIIATITAMTPMMGRTSRRIMPSRSPSGAVSTA
jgi:hypothetical protein